MNFNSQDEAFRYLTELYIRHVFVRVSLKGDDEKNFYFGRIHYVDTVHLILYLVTNAQYDGLCCILLQNVKNVEEDKRFYSEMITFFGKDPLPLLSLTVDPQNVSKSVVQYAMSRNEPVSLTLVTGEKKCEKVKEIQNRFCVLADATKVCFHDINQITAESFWENQ